MRGVACMHVNQIIVASALIWSMERSCADRKREPLPAAVGLVVADSMMMTLAAEEEGLETKTGAAHQRSTRQLEGACGRGVRGREGDRTGELPGLSGICGAGAWLVLAGLIAWAGDILHSR